MTDWERLSDRRKRKKVMMKKKMKAFVACGILFVGLPIIAATETIGDYTWSYHIENGSAVLTSDSGGAAISPSPTNSITIPPTLGGKPVRKIGNNAFYCCFNLPSITIPDGVTDIGDYAFCYCVNLANITIPDGVVSIGRGTFRECYHLTTVRIPNSVTAIGDEVFYNCVKLSNLTLPNNLKSIGNFFFQNCQSLWDITIPNGVTNIGRQAFIVCTNLTNVTIPNNVISIRDFAFNGCSSVKSIIIPESVARIGGDAFSECSKLMAITVSDGNLHYKSEGGLLLTKDGCSLVAVPGGLTSMTIPVGVTSIGNSAFRGCRYLDNVIVPESVERIGIGAFILCDNLEKIKFRGMPPTVGNNAFAGCEAIGFYSNYKAKWESEIDANGCWNGLKMKLGASIDVKPTAMNWVKSGMIERGLTIEWTWSANEDDEATPPVSYSIYYSDNTNSYDTANVVVEGLSGLLRSYKDSQYLNRLDGLKPVCYFVVGSDGSVGVCQTRNRHGILVGLNEWENSGLKPIYGDRYANYFYNLALLQ